MRLLITLIIFLAGCANSTVPDTALRGSNDVLILSILVQDHLRTTNGDNFNMTELLQKDTLNRIANSFKAVEMESKAGYIAVRYKFSESRDPKEIVLTDKEKELAKHIRWKEKHLKKDYDGEIRFDFGERFYRLIKIIVRV